ncbi:Zinc finger RING/FYVE/PHD-type protein [Dioscorea alata]|uniref:Zinc finger RING/FYVE/PHD-type protein n=1 Tax=Dioscorea alata TaxID=55571 RepID=A0ACB7W0F1_DIOAL|nr:Zinc finger RING/FYVE/PHD-type protein [Dioscorea alata]
MRSREERLGGMMMESLGPLDVAGVQIPYHFRCPISLELMRDPVTVSTGQTYDRASIESWVATGNTTCPVTRSPLTEFTLIPNHTLRRLIQDWCVAHRSQGVERIPTPKQPADPSLVRHLVAQAVDSGLEVEIRIGVLRRMRALARESEKNRVVMGTHETRSALIELAFGDGDADLEVEAIGVLAGFAMTEGEAAGVAGRAERVARLARWVAEGEAMEVRIAAAAVIEAVAVAGGRVALGAAEWVMEGIVGLVKQKGNTRGVMVGIRALFALCLARENRVRAVAAGAAEAVVERVGEMGMDSERALATVELLCRGEGGREAVMEVGGGDGAGVVRALVRAMAGRAGERAAEHAAGALVALVSGAEVLQREAVAAGVVTHLLLMVQGGCSERARRKAQLLLKILRNAWAPLHQSMANSDDFIQAF